jgi:hypothetical protein
MKYENKTREQLIHQLRAMYGRIAELGKKNAEYRQVAEALRKSERNLSIESRLPIFFSPVPMSKCMERC